ncbi:glycerol-3-phosphate dehydrogenase [Pseudoruegeria sp. SHC-113]|uniref:glycerol-3-phosphate dehydrogenase n=1 Tax=Pseudoruegeria sp. SHC-113 TaxID=2855439 RepID=UPI0021BB459D|nr:glycerol-3-phosphate dehydrogenase [Pseudoruegeria sp. SHC-113]MCT8161655.1 glycerol-3-phosphate dehydrogenase [Pseudoruegeria sp. SHC-113]
MSETTDLFIIGGGINGCGIARDAAGRGLSVRLVEMNDLASATSSASTKLFHGGLRYLEFFEFRLVREALIEREVLLSAMPHISWPMRFVLPYSSAMRFESDTPTSKLLSTVMPWMKGRRPAWLIRLGLAMYDTMGGRKILPATRKVDLKDTPVGAPLQPKFSTAWEYSDCWVQDARLVILNARDAEARGAEILPRTKMLSAEREGDLWKIRTQNTETGAEAEYTARAIVNAGGPWVEDVMTGKLRRNTGESIRLVRGSHIVVPKLYDHDRCYFFQGEDGRIIFAIPYEEDFTLIGTTDADHKDLGAKPVCTPEEQAYLCAFASKYFKQPITTDQIVWTYSGVRPLYDDGASSATAATREYVLSLDEAPGAPLLNVFGGKITTYRKLAEAAMAKLAPRLGNEKGIWTAGVPLPGGDFAYADLGKLHSDLASEYPFLTPAWLRRMVKAYGTETRAILGKAEAVADLGQYFGASLTEAELRWLVEKEYARTAEDVLWRRGKLGLRLSAEETAAVEDWMEENATSKA